MRKKNMDRISFLNEFSKIIQQKNHISFETDLESLESWDSLAVISTVVFLGKNFGVKCNFEDIEKLKCIEDIAKLAKI